jgi:hypothetical protein
MMKALIPLVAALAGAILAGPVQAADIKLNRQAVLDLARSDKLLCSDWRAKDASCGDIGFMDVVSDSQIRQTYRYQLSIEPNLQVLIQETSTLDGDALCSTFRYDALDLIVLLDGQPAPDEQSLAIGALFQQSMAEFEGKRACETFARDAATGEVHSTVTLDGRPEPTLDSTYRLLAPADRIHLRPADQGEDPGRLET